MRDSHECRVAVPGRTAVETAARLRQRLSVGVLVGEDVADAEPRRTADDELLLAGLLVAHPGAGHDGAENRDPLGSLAHLTTHGLPGAEPCDVGRIRPGAEDREGVEEAVRMKAGLGLQIPGPLVGARELGDSGGELTEQLVVLGGSGEGSHATALSLSAWGSDATPPGRNWTREATTSSVWGSAPS